MSCLHSSEGENRQREAGSQTHHRPVGRHQDAGRKSANATSHMSTEVREWGGGGGEHRGGGVRKRDWGMDRTTGPHRKQREVSVG